MRFVVGRLDEFPEGGRKIVEVGGRSIGIFRIGGEFYAINNSCPHMGGPLCLGRVRPWVRSTRPGEFAMDESDATIGCPWHNWQYDLATGQSFVGPSEPAARTYDVGVVVGPDAVGDREPGPFVAETFDVDVEDAHVVVETRPRRTATRGAAPHTSSRT